MQIFDFLISTHSERKPTTDRERVAVSLCTARFNERLVLSLATNPAALLMDDEMNVLPTSSHVRSIKALPRDEDGAVLLPGPSAASAAELADLVASLADTQVPPLPPLSQKQGGTGPDRIVICMRACSRGSLLSERLSAHCLAHRLHDWLKIALLPA